MQIIIDIPQLLDSCGYSVPDSEMPKLRTKMEEFIFGYLADYIGDILQGIEHTNLDAIDPDSMTQEQCRELLIKDDAEGAEFWRNLPADSDFRTSLKEHIRDFGQP